MMMTGRGALVLALLVVAMVALLAAAFGWVGYFMGLGIAAVAIWMAA